MALRDKGLEALRNGDFRLAALCMADGEAEASKAHLMYSGYFADIIDAGEMTVKVLEATRDVSFSIAIAAGALAAAPVLVLAGATALETGAVVAVGGAVVGGGLRGASSIGGQALAGGHVSGKEAGHQFWEGFKSGAVDAGGAVVGLGAGKLLGVGAKGAGALSNVAKSGVAGAAGGGFGGGLGATLEGKPPEEIAKATLVNAGTGLLGGSVGTGTGSILRSQGAGSRFISGVAGGYVAGAGGTLIAGGSWDEANKAGLLGGISGGVSSTAHSPPASANPDPAPKPRTSGPSTRVKRIAAAATMRAMVGMEQGLGTSAHPVGGTDFSSVAGETQILNVAPEGVAPGMTSAVDVTPAQVQKSVARPSSAQVNELLPHDAPLNAPGSVESPSSGATTSATPVGALDVNVPPLSDPHSQGSRSNASRTASTPVPEQAGPPSGAGLADEFTPLTELSADQPIAAKGPDAAAPARGTTSFTPQEVMAVGATAAANDNATPPLPVRNRAANDNGRIDIRGQFQNTSTVGNGGKTYDTTRGSLGRPGEVVAIRDLPAQQSVSRRTGDDAGHRVAASLGGPGGVENLARQNRIANRYGTFRQLERAWGRLLDRGFRVQVEVTDVTKPGEDRPFMRRVLWTEFAPDGTESRFSLDFANTHTRSSRAAMNPPPGSGP